MARALGAKHAMSSTTNHAKAEQAKALGFNEVIDTPWRSWVTACVVSRAVMRRHCHRWIGGEVLSEALGALALGGSLTTLGYSASRKTTIDVTHLIVPQASIRSLNMFLQPQAAITEAWKVIVSLLQSGAIKPIVAKTFPLAKATDALRYLVEGRPFAGRPHDLTTSMASSITSSRIVAGSGVRSRKRRSSDMVDNKESRNKELVLKAFDALFNRRDYAEAERYWSPRTSSTAPTSIPGAKDCLILSKGCRPRLNMSRA